MICPKYRTKRATFSIFIKKGINKLVSPKGFLCSSERDTKLIFKTFRSRNVSTIKKNSYGIAIFTVVAVGILSLYASLHSDVYLLLPPGWRLCLGFDLLDFQSVRSFDRLSQSFCLQCDFVQLFFHLKICQFEPFFSIFTLIRKKNSWTTSISLREFLGKNTCRVNFIIFYESTIIELFHSFIRPSHHSFTHRIIASPFLTFREKILHPLLNSSTAYL